MGSRTVVGLKKDSLTAEVVIVGAGPAGCAAAYDLAAAGIQVLLLDRTEFPRRKACAGGLTVKALRALRYPITPVMQRTVCDLSVSCRMRHRRRFKSTDPICSMVERPAFDLFCLNRTVDAGARFAVVNRIDKIIETGRAVSLVTDGGLIRSRFLIGADGVHSRVRQLTGRFPAFRAGFAVEGIVDLKSPIDLCMGFDFSQVVGGYGWVFPKHGHINAGLYTHRSDVKITGRDLIDYVSRRIDGALPTRIAGYPLGLGGWRYRPGDGRVLLAGDAAGLVDPLLGEGLYHAISSGQRAAVATAEALDTGSDACKAYAKEVMVIQRDLLFSHAAAVIFYGLPGMGHLLLTSPAAAGPLMEGFSRGMPLLDIFRYAYRFWLGRPGSVKQKRNSF